MLILLAKLLKFLPAIWVGVGAAEDCQLCFNSICYPPVGFFWNPPRFITITFVREHGGEREMISFIIFPYTRLSQDVGCAGGVYGLGKGAIRIDHESNVGFAIVGGVLPDSGNVCWFDRFARWAGQGGETAAADKNCEQD
jgi:hypothetical protein